MVHAVFDSASGDAAHQLAEILCQCFNIPRDKWSRFAGRVGLGNFRTMTVEDRVIAGLGFYPMAHWFGGKRVATRGVCTVGVALEGRGTGVAAQLMAENLREQFASGIPLSTLYASTQRLYRKVGYEQAGTRQRYEIAASGIALADRGCVARQVDPDELPRAVYTQRAQRSNGMLDRNAGIWSRTLDAYDGTPIECYELGASSALEGYVLLQQISSGPGQLRAFVRDFVCLTQGAARRAWTLLSDLRSIVDTIAWYGPATEPLLAHVPEQNAKVTDTLRFMLRVVDVERALTQRGYPRGVRSSVAIEVEDPILPANNACFVLSVADGDGHVERKQQAGLRVPTRWLGPLYSGMWRACELRAHGFLQGDDASVAAADVIFSGPESWMPDMF